MAYDGAQLSLTSRNIGQLDGIWIYRGTDTFIGTVDGADYFSDGYTRGMRTGQLMIYHMTDGTVPTLGYVSAVTATTGVVTVTALNSAISKLAVSRSGVSWTGSSDSNILSTETITGVLTQSTVAAAHVFNINSDAVDATTAAGNYNGYFGHVVNSASAKGHKTALAGVVVVSHATGNTGTGKFYTGSAGIAQATVNDNGVTGAGNGRGNLFGGFSSSSLLTAATFWNSCVGHEVDIEIRSACSASYKIGFQVVQRTTDVVQGTTFDAGYVLANQTGGTAPGWNIGLTFGSPTGDWPIAATGTIIGTSASALGGPSYAATYGVDLSAVTFGTAAYKSTGFLVSPTGITTVKALVAQPGASQTPAVNGDVTFQLTDNTTLTFKAKGSDGSVRSGAITLS